MGCWRRCASMAGSGWSRRDKPRPRGAGVLASDQGDMPAATSLLEASVRLSRAAGDKQGIARGLNWLGLQSQVAGDYERAKTLLEESLAIGRDIADRSTVGFVLGYL